MTVRLAFFFFLFFLFFFQGTQITKQGNGELCCTPGLLGHPLRIAGQTSPTSS